MAESTARSYRWQDLPYYTRVTIVGLIVYALLFEALGVLYAALGEYFLMVFASIIVVPTLSIRGARVEIREVAAPRRGDLGAA